MRLTSDWWTNCDLQWWYSVWFGDAHARHLAQCHYLQQFTSSCCSTLAMLIRVWACSLPQPLDDCDLPLTRAAQCALLWTIFFTSKQWLWHGKRFRRVIIHLYIFGAFAYRTYACMLLFIASIDNLYLFRFEEMKTTTATAIYYRKFTLF